MMSPFNCPAWFRGSFSDQDWQMDVSQVSSSTVCNVFRFHGIFTGWTKLLPIYMGQIYEVSFMQMIVKEFLGLCYLDCVK